MPWEIAVALGALQGVTEFLPISSSGHLILVERLLGAKPPGLAWEVALHVGTLGAVLAVYGREVLALLGAALDGPRRWRSAPGDRLVALVLASLPAAAAALVLEDFVGGPRFTLRWLGLCWVISGLLVAAFTRRPGRGQALTLRRAVGMGLAQGLAVLPGISRSGATIAVGMGMGLEPGECARFSFLLSVPAVVGAMVFTGADLAAQGAPPVGTLVLGAVVSGLTGYAALRLLLRLLTGGRLWWWGAYTIVLGTAVWALGAGG